MESTKTFLQSTYPRIDYRRMCREAFQDNAHERDMVVHNGRDEHGFPHFKKVHKICPCMVSIGSNPRIFFGIVGLDMVTGEAMWYNYNDCVSMEDFGVLDRLIASRYPWMLTVDPSCAVEAKRKARLLLSPESSEPRYTKET